MPPVSDGAPSSVPRHATSLRLSVAASIYALVRSVDPASIVSIGAYTDADASNVVTALQTRGHYDALVEATPEYRNYFRWSIGEFDVLSFEALGDDPLRGPNDELGQLARTTAAGRAMDEFRASVWDAVVAGVADAVAGGRMLSVDTVVVFEPLDAEVSEERIRTWTAALNDERRMVEYDAWAANRLS